MSDNLWIELSAAASGVWLGIAVAALVIAVAALAVSHSFTSAIVRRTVWQVAGLASLGCITLELSGIGQASLAAIEAELAVRDSEEKAADSPEGLSTDVAANVIDDAALGTPGHASGQLDAGWSAHEQNVVDLRDFLRPSSDVSESPSIKIEAAPTSPPIVAMSEPVYGDSEEPFSLFIAAAALLSVVITAVLLVRQMAARHSMASLVRALPKYLDTNGHTAADIREISARLHFRRVVRVVALPANSSPIAFGMIRPTIGLPGNFATRFSAEQRQAVLAHELAHLAGHDPLWRCLCDVLVAALWWHPAVWFIRRRLIDASEAVADEASRAIPGGAEHLASALVVLGKRIARRGAVRAAYGAEGEFRSALGRRVERLLAECETPW